MKQFATALAATLLAIAIPAAAQNGPRRNGPGPGLIAPTAPLTDAETKTLVFVREEEKLARDVYNKLYEKWGLSVFANVGASEEQHFEAAGYMLERYQVPDPAAGKPAGVYTDERLNALYSELVERGMKSLKDALAVGILIEKTDISDLEAAIQATTKADLKRFYTNLMNASYNHQEAFETCAELTQ